VWVESLESACGAQKELTRISPALLLERDPRSQQVDTRVGEFVEHPGLDSRQQLESGIEVARVALRGGGCEKALRAMRALGCEGGGPLEEGRAGRQPAARLRPSGRALELGRHLLVGARRRLRPVPGSPIGVEIRVGRLGERVVRLSPFARLGRAVDRRPHERMAERHRVVEGQEAFRLDHVCGRFRDPEQLGRPPQQHGIPERLRRGHEQERSRLERRPGQPAREAPLDPRRQGQRRRQAEAAGELGRGEPAGKLQDRERIPASLGDDPLEDRLVESRREDGLEQDARVAAAERLDRELREARQL
jgi:hypothetical protein